MVGLAVPRIQQPSVRLQFSNMRFVYCTHSGAYAPNREEVTALLSAGV